MYHLTANLIYLNGVINKFIKMNDNEKEIFEKTYQNALRILDFSSQTEKTLTSKLAQKGYSKEIILEVMIRLKNI